MKCSKYRTSHYFKKFYFYPMKSTAPHTTTTPPAARHYHSALSLWLSVAALRETRLSIS